MRITNGKVAADAGIPLLNGDPAAMEKMRAFAARDLSGRREDQRTTFGVADADVIAAGFQAMYSRWLDLVDPVESRDPLRKLFWTRMFQNVDIGALNPPSLIMILYSVMAQAPVGKLFIGGRW